MLTIVCGKPGTGKSYHVVARLVEFFCEAALFEHKEGTRFERVVWSNIALNLHSLNDLVAHRTGIEDVDVSHYYRHLDQEFFASDLWWETFPEASHIVIDEVHKHLCSKSFNDGRRVFSEGDLVNWLSTHRHQRQDVTLLSQALVKNNLPNFSFVERVIPVAAKGVRFDTNGL